MVDGLLQVEGGRPLSGEITVRGAKNLVSKAMVAALLGATPSVLRNVPLIRDVDVVSGLLALHGVAIDYDQAEGVLSLDIFDIGADRIDGRGGFRCTGRPGTVRSGIVLFVVDRATLFSWHGSG